jgi:formylglycine-generating enzyme required for sulfatase activity
LDADGTYNESDDGEWLACNFLRWIDGCAYLDWAGLRPMTELEFEKVCRGGQDPVSDEYAWGTQTIASSVYSFSNLGAANEDISANYSTIAGNAIYTTTGSGSAIGSLRTGIFAGNASNVNRITAGATFYGVMEMSGNQWERIVTIGNADGRVFTGVHGNGRLSANGYANQANWPGLTSGEVTGASGSGFRGGAWNTASALLEVSDRSNAVYLNASSQSSYGFRGVRTAAP